MENSIQRFKSYRYFHYWCLAWPGLAWPPPPLVTTCGQVLGKMSPDPNGHGAEKWISKKCVGEEKWMD